MDFMMMITKLIRFSTITSLKKQINIAYVCLRGEMDSETGSAMAQILFD